MTNGNRRARYGVKRSRRRKKTGYDDCFRVRANIGQLDGAEKTPVELIDSDQFDPEGLDSDGFDEWARNLHGLRRRDGRARKGRLFYISAGDEVVAFVAFHVPPASGPLIVENLVLHNRFASRQRAVARIRRILLHAVLEASEAAERTAELLAWATDDDGKAARIEAEFGFAAVKRPDNSDCGLKHYLERSFPPAG